MRKKKLLRTLGLLVGGVVVLLLAAVAVFLFNPFEGSLADLRYVVPRDVDFFARKVDLAEDFSEFPEPWFWNELSQHPDWRQVQAGPLHAKLNGRGQITQALEQLRTQLEQVRSQSKGMLDLTRDVLGREVQVAGRIPAGAGTAAYCAYARVSWRTKAAVSLLRYGFVQEQLRAQGVQVLADGELLQLQPGQGQPLFAARYRDCVMLGNDKDLLKRSYDLAAGIGDPDSFGSSAYYHDGIEKRLEEWHKTTGQLPNAAEFFLRPPKLLSLPDVTFDDGWPNPNHPNDMNVRVLAAFLNLQSWLGLTGAVVFEEGSASLLATIELNQNKHTAFQGKFFQTESQPRGEWLDPFLSMVPQSACAVAAMRMPATDFIEEMYGALESAEKELMNEALRKTGKYQSVPELIRSLDLAFEPRTGFVFRKNVPENVPDPIPVASPSPMPQVAWVFWMTKRGPQMVNDLVDLVTKYREVIGLENAYNYPLGLSGAKVGGDAAREFVHRQIPATGSIATLVFAPFFVISNSGPFIRDMMHTLMGNRPSIKTLEDFREYQQELPSSVNGFVYIQGPEFERVLKDYEADIVNTATSPDPEWASKLRSTVELEVFRRKFAGRFGSMAAMPQEARAEFDRDVDAELEQRWRQERTTYNADALGAVREAMALTRLFKSAYAQISLEPRYLKLTGRTIARFK